MDAKYDSVDNQIEKSKREAEKERVVKLLTADTRRLDFDEITLTIYDGTTTHDYISKTLNGAIDAAMAGTGICK